MRQVVVTRHGGPDVFEARDVEDPSPGEGEVRIRVRASGVNFGDVLARMGRSPTAPKPPVVVGYEVAGYVDAVGPGVTGLFEGNHVFALTRFGGYSDTIVAPMHLVYRVPGELSDAEAAAIPVNYLTAMMALYKMANLMAGETVLVHGAGNGVGIAATQLARLRRARIVGTASARKHDALRSFGVDHVIDYRTDVEQEVRRLTGNRGVDVILDPFGSSSFRRSYRMLAPFGRLIMFGLPSVTPLGRPFLSWLRDLVHLPCFSSRSLVAGNRGVFGLNLERLWDDRPRLAAAMDMLNDELQVQRLRPVVARTFPLEQAAEAHRFLESRQNIGKVVLTT